jgi:hypothetical protein
MSGFTSDGRPEQAPVPDAPTLAHDGAAAASGKHPERLGDFRLLREVGRGGMGVVYEAEQISLGRRVALKVLPSSALPEPRQLERFEHEARAAARLHHTNIVPVYGFGEHHGVHFLVMQLIDGRPLDAVLAELRSGRAVPAGLSDPGRQRCRAVARLGIQVAEALAYAHGQGVLHRDIKPANLLLDGQGMVWVSDFGLAKAAGGGDLTGTGEVVGTLRYIPPERFRGLSDARGDLYSLGLTLYELLTLRPAFDREERYKLIEAILHDEPPRPRQIDPQLPRDLETVVLKATAKDPARRYASAAELADDLRRFAEDRPIKARRAAAWERLGRWRRRNPALAAAVGVAAAALLAVTVLSVGFGVQKAGDARRLQQQKEALDDALETSETRRRLLEIDRQRVENLRGAARLAFGRGLALAEQGETAEGMLWMARALEIAPADDGGLQRLLRVNLGACRQRVGELKAALPYRTSGSGPAVLRRYHVFGDGLDPASSDGKFVVTVARPGRPRSGKRPRAGRSAPCWTTRTSKWPSSRRAGPPCSPWQRTRTCASGTGLPGNRSPGQFPPARGA